MDTIPDRKFILLVVILSKAKDLSVLDDEILRFAQDDDEGKHRAESLAPKEFMELCPSDREAEG